MTKKEKEYLEWISTRIEVITDFEDFKNSKEYRMSNGRNLFSDPDELSLCEIRRTLDILIKHVMKGNKNGK